MFILILRRMLVAIPTLILVIRSSRWLVKSVTLLCLTTCVTSTD